MSELAIAIVLVALVVLILVWQIVRWITATVGLGKAVHDSTKRRKELRSESAQFERLTSDPTAPDPDDPSRGS